MCVSHERLTAFGARTFLVMYDTMEQERLCNALNACKLNKREFNTT
jgi:hypothetical protein